MFAELLRVRAKSEGRTPTFFGLAFMTLLDLVVGGLASFGVVISVVKGFDLPLPDLHLYHFIGGFICLRLALRQLRWP